MSRGDSRGMRRSEISSRSGRWFGGGGFWVLGVEVDMVELVKDGPWGGMWLCLRKLRKCIGDDDGRLSSVASGYQLL